MLRARQRLLKEETAEEPLWSIITREVVEWGAGWEWGEERIELLAVSGKLGNRRC